MALRDVVRERGPLRLCHPRRAHGRQIQLPEVHIPMHPARRALAVQLARGDGHHLLTCVGPEEQHNHDPTGLLQGPLGTSRFD